MSNRGKGRFFRNFLTDAMSLSNFISKGKVLVAWIRSTFFGKMIFI